MHAANCQMIPCTILNSPDGLTAPLYFHVVTSGCSATLWPHILFCRDDIQLSGSTLNYWIHWRKNRRLTHDRSVFEREVMGVIVWGGISSASNLTHLAVNRECSVQMGKKNHFSCLALRRVFLNLSESPELWINTLGHFMAG